MSGLLRGGCGVLALRSVWHQLFGDEGEAKLLSIVGQRCRGSCCPQRSMERLRISSQQAEIPHSMAQQLPLSWDAPRVPSTGVAVPGESAPSVSSPHPKSQHQVSDMAKQRVMSSKFSCKPWE